MLPEFADPRIAAFFAVYFGTLFLAASLGGAPERFGALTLLSMFLVQLVPYSSVSNPVFDQVDWVSVASDATALLGFTLIALNADRLWPLLAAAMQLISTLAHFARISTDMLGFSYAQFKAVPTTLAILLVLLGTILHQVRLLRAGHDRAWVPHRKYREFRAFLRELDIDR